MTTRTDMSAIDLNDHPKTTFKDIKAVLQKPIYLEDL